MTIRKSEAVSSMTGIKIIVPFEIYRNFNQTIFLVTHTEIKVSDSRKDVSTSNSC